YIYNINNTHTHIDRGCSERAFDGIDWNFLFQVLSHMEIVSQFLKWITALYTSPKAPVQINGIKSPPLCELHRGIRQGCPLSP
uniref:Reverse transcriptase n=1 Tax=Chrysemys picta bellii TaxID=8478 RepID=A0A8C3ICU2_CHRPI